MADKAILFGINDYRSISDLRGCINDVENMKQLLERRGFSKIKTFIDEDVTKKQVKKGFKWLFKNAAVGDRLVFHFSGHGSYIKSEDNDEEYDELLCLYGMDWDDSDSFLLDDELDQIVSGDDSGARLTVILDCCHSGTGTKEVTKANAPSNRSGPRTRLLVVKDEAFRIAGGHCEKTARSLHKGAKKAFKSLRQEGSPTLARFVKPPENHTCEKEVVPISRGFAQFAERMETRGQLNHQLLAGAADNQTAADAFINGDFHGAFTYYLCENANAGGASISYRSVMAETIQEIKDKGHSQIPQLEGPFADEVLFGGSVIGSSNKPSQPPSLFSKIESSAGHCESASPLETLDSLLRISEKLIDLAKPISTTAVPKTSRSTTEHIVYVHGISQHLPGYSDGWFASLLPHLSRTLARKEVLWSRHVNPRSISRAAEQEAAEFADSIHQELKRRASRTDRSLTTTRGDGLGVDDFARYMTISATRAAILAEFDTVVRPLLAAGHSIQIVSHSWGTVVAYEGLRQLDSISLDGQVKNLFTVGSALSIGLVQSNLFGRVIDGRLPANVDRIINLDAGGDIVGGPIGDEFTVAREFIGLEPTGCSTIPFTDIAWNPSCAHSSYFEQDNREVNRDIFARFIN